MLNRLTKTFTDTQIKAFPTTPLTLLPAPGAGFRNKIVGVSLSSSFAAGAYTNVNTVYADLRLRTAAPHNICYLALNDNTVSPVVSRLSDLLSASVQTADVIPYFIFSVPGAVGVRGYVFNGSATAIGTLTTGWDNDAIQILADNNGSGNWTGGNAANTLKITTYFIKEAV